MSPPPITGWMLYHTLRQAGVVLSIEDGCLAFDAPVGAITPELRELMKARKADLLAVVCGDYLSAARELVLSVHDAGRREALVEWFDERAGIGEFDGGRSRSAAERSAYIYLSIVVERGIL
jgi:hypothetical protein